MARLGERTRARPRARITTRILFAALGVWLAQAASAQAATVAVVQTFGAAEVQFVAAPGETNDVLVSADGSTFVIADAAAAVQPGDGCTAASAGSVRCADAEVGKVSVELADGRDRARVEAAVYGLLAASFPGESVVRLLGGDGDDELAGGDGPDAIAGGAGSDSIDGGAGDDFAGGGADALPGGGTGAEAPDRDVVRGGPGNDFVSGSIGADVVAGGPGADTLDGGPGDDVLDAGDGDDRFIIGGDGDDVVDGGAGDEHDLFGGPGDDVVRGGAGDDTVEHLPFDLGPDAVGFHDLGADVLDGGPGRDTLGGGAEGSRTRPDVLIGGEGFDTVTYAYRRTPVVADIDHAADDGAAGERDDLRPDVEAIVGGRAGDALGGSGAANLLEGRAGDDTLDGGAGADVLTGGLNDDGNDTLLGRAGDDVLRGGPGDDALDGGEGADTLAAGGGSDSVSGGDGPDDAAGGPGLDVVAGGAGDDTLRGGESALVGADGADTLDGGAGADTLLAGPGDDTLDGGAGADRFAGDAGRDTASYAARTAPVTVTLDGTANDGEAGEADLVGGDVEDVLGGAGADTLVGDTGANALNGAAGDDALDGGRGVDTLEGGRGGDVLRARDGVADLVSCGEDTDLAVADPRDTARDCELLDRGGPRRRLPRGALELAPRTGRVLVALPGFVRKLVLRDDLLVPVGTVVDAMAGSVRVAAAGRRGRRRSATLSGGAFSLRPGTELALGGGDFDVCTRATRTRVIRRLAVRSGRAGAGLRVRGRRSLVAGRGRGVWSLADRCDGTLTRVARGAVTVRDRATGRALRVRGPGRHLARADVPD